MNIRCVGIFAMTSMLASIACGSTMDLSNAVVHCAEASQDRVIQTAVQYWLKKWKRTGNTWQVSRFCPITALRWCCTCRRHFRRRFFHNGSGERVHLSGADGRGLLYAVGRFLRTMEWGKGTIHFPEMDINPKPGLSHAWPSSGIPVPVEFLRHLMTPLMNSTFVNSPFSAATASKTFRSDDRTSPHMPLDRRSMNRRISEICHGYGLDYWVWTPASSTCRTRKARGSSG